MPLTLNGTTGIAGVDGSAGTPAAQGSDTNTGVFYGADTVSITTGGTARVVVNSDGQTVLGAGTASLPAMSTTGDLNTGTFYPAADTIGWTTGGSERARIDSFGNLLVNTTLTALYNQTSGYGVCYRKNASFDILTTSDNTLILNRAGTDGTTIEFRKSGTVVGSVSVTGSATAYNTSSDYRLKENIHPMSGALSKVAQLEPVTYTWKADGSAGQGFIAHELQAVVPDCVTGAKDAVDTDGNPVYQGVDTSFLVATLTAAIQELSAKLDAAEARIAALEAK